MYLLQLFKHLNELHITYFIMKSISRTLSIKNNLAILGATTPNTLLDTTESNDSEDTAPANDASKNVSSSISTISSSKSPVSAITSATTNKFENNSSIAATSTSNTTEGNISTQKKGGKGAADGVTSSYSVFVLSVVGACVLNVPEV